MSTQLGSIEFFKRNKLFFSALLFLGYFAFFQFVVYRLFFLGYLDYLLRYTTLSSAWLIKAIGIQAHVSANKIFLASRTLIIDLECTAVFIAVLYISFVLAYPAKAVRKLTGIAVGVSAIFIANVLRIGLIAVVSERFPRYFDYLHDYVWQVAFILMTALLWIMWVSRGFKSER